MQRWWWAFLWALEEEFNKKKIQHENPLGKKKKLKYKKKKKKLNTKLTTIFSVLAVISIAIFSHQLNRLLYVLKLSKQHPNLVRYRYGWPKTPNVRERREGTIQKVRKQVSEGKWFGGLGLGLLSADSIKKEYAREGNTLRVREQWF